MRMLAALLPAFLLTGCVLHFPPGRDTPDGKRGPLTVIVCVFANCKLPEKQETPTPATNSPEKRVGQQASRLDPGARGQGIGPN